MHYLAAMLSSLLRPSTTSKQYHGRWSWGRRTPQPTHSTSEAWRRFQILQWRRAAWSATVPSLLDGTTHEEQTLLPAAAHDVLLEHRAGRVRCARSRRSRCSGLIGCKERGQQVRTVHNTSRTSKGLTAAFAGPSSNPTHPHPHRPPMPRAPPPTTTPPSQPTFTTSMTPLSNRPPTALPSAPPTPPSSPVPASSSNAASTYPATISTAFSSTTSPTAWKHAQRSPSTPGWIGHAMASPSIPIMTWHRRDNMGIVFWRIRQILPRKWRT